MTAGTRFVASYSGGKDSVLAIHRAMARGMELEALIITKNEDRGRSWFHGLPDDVLDRIERAVGVPVVRVVTDGDHYAQRFEEALAAFARQGVQACVFGDIDLEGHREWGEARCAAAGLKAVYPLWGESRRELVFEGIDAGYASVVTVVDPSRVDASLVGRTLSPSVVEAIEACGADACGENGEYHTFTHAGPLFSGSLGVKFGTAIAVGSSVVVPILTGKGDHGIR